MFGTTGRVAVAVLAVVAAGLVASCTGPTGRRPPPAPDAAPAPAPTVAATARVSCPAAEQAYAALIGGSTSPTLSRQPVSQPVRGDLAVLADAYGRYVRALARAGAGAPSAVGLADAAAALASPPVVAAARELDRSVVGPCR